MQLRDQRDRQRRRRDRFGEHGGASVDVEPATFEALSLERVRVHRVDHDRRAVVGADAKAPCRRSAVHGRDMQFRHPHDPNRRRRDRFGEHDGVGFDVEPEILEAVSLDRVAHGFDCRERRVARAFDCTPAPQAARGSEAPKEPSERSGEGEEARVN